METLLFPVAFIMTALALGGMVFFGAVTAPTTFINLDEFNAGKLIRAMFPRYYFYVAASSTIGAIASLSHSYDAALGLGLSSLTAVCGWGVLMPRVNSARDSALTGDKKAAKTFEVLHRLSVWINFVGLLGVILATVVLSLNPENPQFIIELIIS